VSGRRLSRYGAAAGLIALCGLLLLLAGCPFSSDKPLSDPESAVPEPGLLGTWKMQDPDSHEWHQLTIFPFDQHEMVAFAPENDLSKVSGFRLFVTRVGRERFLNLQELGASEPGWFFARLELDQNHLHLWIVDDSLFDTRSFDSPSELAEFVLVHLSDPRLYVSGDDHPAEAVLERVPDRP